MKEIRKVAYAEVDAILDLLDSKFTEKVPVKVREFIKANKDEDYMPNINPNISLEEQNLKRETVSFLTLLQINYWCESEEEKQEIIRELENTDKIKERELIEKYNPEYLFKKTNNSQEQNVAIVEYKEQNFIKKILDRIRKLFKRN